MNKSYHQLLFEYACSETDGASFTKWLEKNNYRFRVNNKIFKDFDKMFDYLMQVNEASGINNTFEIIDSKGNIVGHEESI